MKKKAKSSLVEIDKLDPYQLMAVLGKKVIHPGGLRSTEEMLEMAKIISTDRVLEIGCGVGTTAIAIAKRYGAQVIAVDIDEGMIDIAIKNVNEAGCKDKVHILKADILNLPFEAGEFDCILIEAVTMFVDQKQAASEILRVCKKGGRVLDHEFIWKKIPPEEVKYCFTNQLCSGVYFDTTEDWVNLYKNTGLSDIQVKNGPFAMMTPSGFLRDEGVIKSVIIFVKMFSRMAYLRKMAWFMPKMITISPYLGYAIVSGIKK